VRQAFSLKLELHLLQRMPSLLQLASQLLCSGVSLGFLLAGC
jgi:hypothetical protein